MRTYPEETSALRHMLCDPTVLSNLRYFDVYRMMPHPEVPPRPNPDHVAYTLETMSRAVARLCNTTNECRGRLLDLVQEMELRKQQLLLQTMELRHTLKTLLSSFQNA